MNMCVLPEMKIRLKSPELFIEKAFVGGLWIEGEGSNAVFDPASGVQIAKTAKCGPDHVRDAVSAADDARYSWATTLPIERGKLLRKWASLIREHGEDLAIIITSEQGKPLKEARGEVEYGAGFLDWFAAEAERGNGQTMPSHKSGSSLRVVMQPAGVAVAITPWNFPLAMITRKAGAALAAGCPIIVKPAPETPLTASALATLSEKAGFPTSVFQVLTGDAPTLAKALIMDTRVRVVSFTGSTEVGRILLGLSAASVKKVSMELGGHAPVICFEDMPIEKAVDISLDAKFATSGQDCLAANRIYVHRSNYDRFVSLFAERVRYLKVGHGLDPSSDIGPMTKLSVAEKCRQHILDAVARGATMVCGAEHSLGQQFIAPTVLSHVNDDMLIANEETFGPVAAILSFETEDEVVARANNSEMGLAAYVLTQNLGRATRVSERLEYGLVGINTSSFTGPPVPFGGWKQSGLGREGSHQGMLEFMETKYICTGGLAA
jgi:aspartate-semialdehyde dehydrogenase